MVSEFVASGTAGFLRVGLGVTCICYVRRDSRLIIGRVEIVERAMEWQPRILGRDLIAIVRSRVVCFSFSFRVYFLLLVFVMFTLPNVFFSRPFFRLVHGFVVFRSPVEDCRRFFE